MPRSGSTLLGSLLAQHEDVYVTPTSPVLDLLCFTNDAFNKLNNNYTYKESIDIDIYKAIVIPIMVNIANQSSLISIGVGLGIFGLLQLV